MDVQASSVQLARLDAEVRRDPVVGHHRVQAYSGSLMLQLEALRPIHIMSGYEDVTAGDSREGEQVLALLPRIGSQVVLPGSSLKGAVRTLAEAISPSCEGGQCSSGTGVCPGCAIFGAPGYLGRGTFLDVPVPPDSIAVAHLPALWPPRRTSERVRKLYRHGPAIDRGDPRQVVRAGSFLQGEVRFFNLRWQEMGPLLAALGLDVQHPFPIKLGGGKPVGYGSVRVRLQRIVLWENGNLRRHGRLKGTERDLRGNNEAKWRAQAASEARRAGFIREEWLREVAGVLSEEYLDKPYG